MFGQIVGAISAALKALFRFGRSLPRRYGWKKILLVLGALLIVWLGFSFFSGTPETPAVSNETRSVEIRSVVELTYNTSGLSLGGTVSSLSEATIRAERSGEVTSLSYELGDRVSAGAVIGEIKNASERAAVLQAQAGLESARASAAISGSSIEEARSGAVTAILSAYSATDNATRGTTDALFINPQTNPNLTYPPVALAKGSEDANAERLRKEIIPVVSRQSGASATISASSPNLPSEIDRTEAELRQVRAFLDAVVQALNTAETDDPTYAESLAGYKSTTVAARTAVTGALSSLASAKQTLLSAEQSGGSGTSVSAAAVKQAEASLASARASLEQTIIRAPISGTINSLSLKRGDYVQLGSPVVTIANNSALEVVTYVTESDAREFSVGNRATVRGDIEGTVTRIAPAIDPVTKKIEVRIGIDDSQNTLVNGESVSISIARSSAAHTENPSRLIIPLSALKIGVKDMTVFTLAEDSTLVPHPVEIGLLLGDRVEILEGLTPDMRIVVDARGLRAGEKVIQK